jgi:hypothetical protein
MITLSMINDGDEVRLRDRDGNVITARAHLDGINLDRLLVHAFGTRIYFARKLKSGWIRVAGIDTIAHQPALEFDDA